MHPEEKRLFILLKKEIVLVMQKTYPAVKQEIAEWKGQEITDFQEDLRLKVKAQVSEKWFYTHLKGINHALPRIDILNMLSQYAGYLNWDDFKFRNSEKSADSVPVKISKGNRFFIIIPLLMILVLGIFIGFFSLFNTREYTLHLYDSETLQPITGEKMKLVLLSNNESPEEYISDLKGTIRLKTNQSVLKMVVKSPYYKEDTITRIVRKFNREEKLMLHANDYALMIHYFSQMKVDEWEKRRQQLDSIFSNNALIYRVHGLSRTTGIEVLNKQEFIDFMSVPSSSLRKMEILDIRNSDNKVQVLRFRINEK